MISSAHLHLTSWFSWFWLEEVTVAWSHPSCSISRRSHALSPQSDLTVSSNVYSFPSFRGRLRLDSDLRPCSQDVVRDSPGRQWRHPRVRLEPFPDPDHPYQQTCRHCRQLPAAYHLPFLVAGHQRRTAPYFQGSSCIRSSLELMLRSYAVLACVRRRSLRPSCSSLGWPNTKWKIKINLVCLSDTYLHVLCVLRTWPAVLPTTELVELILICLLLLLVIVLRHCLLRYSSVWLRGRLMIMCLLLLPLLLMWLVRHNNIL